MSASMTYRSLCLLLPAALFGQGCVDELSVGLSRSSASEEPRVEAGVPAANDAGRAPDARIPTARDAAQPLDSGPQDEPDSIDPAPDAGSCDLPASFSSCAPDASEPPAPAGPCPESECPLIVFITATCEDGEPSCRREHAGGVCAWKCPGPEIFLLPTDDDAGRGRRSANDDKDAGDAARDAQ
jgi:hypothetical protein